MVTLTVPPVGTDAWWSAFTVSSGFAGTLAVVAAFVALLGALATAAMNASAARRSRERDRWWEMLTWMEGQLETMDPERATMIIFALQRGAETLFERTVLKAMTARVRLRGRPR